MDAGKFTAIAYRDHLIANPLSPQTLDRTLAAARLKPGMRVLDVGAGLGGGAIHVAEAHGLHVDAIERFAPVAELCRRRVAGRGAPGSITVHETDAAGFLESAGTYDLVMALGAVDLGAADRAPATVFSHMARSVRPGGWLLWGDPYLKRAPSEAFAQVLRFSGEYQPHAAYVMAGETAGLIPRYAATSTDEDWEEYSWKINNAVTRFADENPHDPDAEAFRAHVGVMRHGYVNEGRDVLGFGLYLFEKPA